MREYPVGVEFCLFDFNLCRSNLQINLFAYCIEEQFAK